jgi:hypothetical protein
VKRVVSGTTRCAKLNPEVSMRPVKRRTHSTQAHQRYASLLVLLYAIPRPNDTLPRPLADEHDLAFMKDAIVVLELLTVKGPWGGGRVHGITWLHATGMLELTN